MHPTPNKNIPCEGNSPADRFPPLNIPPARLDVRTDALGRQEVFDPLRGKWVVLTPEEWVRQHFTAWLIAACGYPAERMANEVSLSLNRTRRRADTVFFTRDGRPDIIVEYKRPSVALTQRVFDQIARYNIVMGARLLIVTNGMTCYCCAYGPDATYRFLPDIPRYKP